MFFVLVFIFLQWERKAEVHVPKHSPLRYTACDVNLEQLNPKPNSWLISDQIAVNKAKRIDITVDYLITSCSAFQHNGGPYCVDMFDLYLNQSDQSWADDSSLYPDPLTSAAAYEKVAEIRQTTNKRTTETITVLVKRKHVILAFHNYGSCNVLYSVKITYNVCPDEKLSSSLVLLPRTVAPANDSETMTVEGNCNKDAVRVSGSLYVQCESHGEWNISGLEGRCICKEDMEKVGGNCEGMHYF